MRNIAEKMNGETGVCCVDVWLFGKLVTSDDTSAKASEIGELGCGGAFGIEDGKSTIRGGRRGGYGKGVGKKMVI